MSLEKYILTCIYTQWLSCHTEPFHCPKNALYSVPNPHPLTTTDLLNVSVVLSSPNGLIQYVSGHFFHSVFKYLRFLYVLSWFHITFILILCSIIFYCFDVPQFTHLTTSGHLGYFYLWAIMKSYYRHFPADFCASITSQHLWVNITELDYQVIWSEHVIRNLPGVF
jgi:hypothetical protein